METSSAPGDVATVLARIGHDMRTIASNELELGRDALARRLESLVLKAGVVVIGAVVALIGFAMLCATAVAALGGLIEPLWLRLLIMSVIYLATGGISLVVVAKRSASSDSLEAPVEAAKETIDAVEKGLKD